MPSPPLWELSPLPPAGLHPKHAAQEGMVKGGGGGCLSAPRLHLCPTHSLLKKGVSQRKEKEEGSFEFLSLQDPGCKSYPMGGGVAVVRDSAFPKQGMEGGGLGG